LTNEEIVAELEWTSQIIFDIIGVRPMYFRPPCNNLSLTLVGDIDDRVRAVAAAMNLVPVIWNHDTSTIFL